MKVKEAYLLLMSEMTKHGLIEKGWKAHIFNHDWESIDFSGIPFKMSQYTSVKGTAAITDIGSKKSICLNIRHVVCNEKAIVLNTIRHEIAHALVSNVKGEGHGTKWKLKCIEIGALPYAKCDLENYRVVAFRDYIDNFGEGEEVTIPVEQIRELLP